jgi:phosphatidylinositol alpha-mannosyltransferase
VSARTAEGGRPLAVCLVSAAYRPYPSGISEHVSHLAKAMMDLGVRVQVLTTRFGLPCDDDVEATPVVRLGRAVLVPLNGSYATFPVGLALSRQVRGFFRRESFDVVHCHGVFWPEISYWAVRYADAVRVVSFLSAGFRTTAVGGRLHRALFAGHLRRIQGRIALSEHAHRTYAPYVPGDCRIIPSGVDLERFRPDAHPPPGGMPGRPTLLFVGRLDRRKGLNVALEALPLVSKQLPGARLVVVGGGPGTDAARRRAARLGVSGAVRFVGPVSPRDLPGYYAAADVYLSPALGGESFGIVLLEAMASGVPVVASDIPGYDETVDRGHDGLLVPPSDPAALAGALVRVLSDRDLADSLRSAGLAKAQGHAWPRIASRTLAFYRALATRLPR